MKTDLDKVKKLAKDLRKGCPRSPREKLGGYVIAARCVDKCRAFLLGIIGINGEYNYWPCSLASQWFSFTGITPDQFKGVVATVSALFGTGVCDERKENTDEPP